MRDLDRWLGDGGMPLVTALGGTLTAYGRDQGLGWVEGRWTPTPLSCNPAGTVQAGSHAVLLDAAMSFAVNAALDSPDRSRGTLEIKTEVMRAARSGDPLGLRGDVRRLGRLVAFAEAAARDAEGRLVSRATATFVLHREGTPESARNPVDHPAGNF